MNLSNTERYTTFIFYYGRQKSQKLRINEYRMNILSFQKTEIHAHSTKYSKGGAVCFLLAARLIAFTDSSVLHE